MNNKHTFCQIGTVLQRCLLNVRPVLSSGFVPHEAVVWCSVGFHSPSSNLIPSPFEPAMAFSFPRVRVLVGAAVHHLGTVFPVIKLASVSEFARWLSIVLILFALYSSVFSKIFLLFSNHLRLYLETAIPVGYTNIVIDGWGLWTGDIGAHDEFPFIWLAQVRKEIQETWCPAQSRRT